MPSFYLPSLYRSFRKYSIMLCRPQNLEWAGGTSFVSGMKYSIGGSASSWHLYLVILSRTRRWWEIHTTYTNTTYALSLCLNQVSRVTRYSICRETRWVMFCVTESYVMSPKDPRPRRSSLYISLYELIWIVLSRYLGASNTTLVRNYSLPSHDLRMNCKITQALHSTL